MKWSQFSKPQKEKFLLLLLVGIGAVYSFMAFAVNPYVRRGQETRVELATLRGQLAQAQRSFSREAATREELARSCDEMRVVVSQCIPPVENPLSWVAQRVYGSARDVGVEIESVNDLGLASPAWAQEEDNPRAFVPYSVRIVTQCGYLELVNLIATMEKSNPFLSVSEIQIAAQDDDASKHRISLAVEWPYWRDPAQAAQVLGMEGSSDG